MISQNPPVSVFSEFQPLEKIIVGRAYSPESYNLLEDQETREALQKIALETEEDCQALVQIFQSFGAETLRPEEPPPLYYIEDSMVRKTKISDGRWNTAFPNAPLWPRDLTLALGHKIASVYSRTMGRWTEGQSFYPIFQKLFSEGCDWISMPPPPLKEASDYSAYENDALLFHAACFLKCGQDVFHTRPAGEIQGGKGTSLGLEWVKRQFPEFKFHPFNRPGHIDGKFAILRPGLLLSWVGKDHLPEKFKNWDIVLLESKGDLPAEFLKLRNKRFYKEFITKWLGEWIGYVDETYFDVNVVSLDEKTVVLNSSNSNLIRILNQKGIECVPFNFRHRHFWDGGLHCITLDLKRRGPMEDYFS